MKISALAFAKVNLYLKVLEKRNDGLHNLDMVMQSVSLADKVSVETDEGDGVSVICDGVGFGNNIAEKAALKYFERAGISCPNIRISIEKNIPISGGLAGGSADAAAVLAICNKIYGKLNMTEILDLAGEIGSDVPFCLSGGCARVRGFGDKIEPIESADNYTLVLVKAGEKRSTGYMYSLIDNSDEHIKSNADDLVAKLLIGSGDACDYMENDFTKLWDDSVSKDICSQLAQNGADVVSLSGSGPTFFGVFYDNKVAEKCCEALRLKYKNTFICCPKKCGIEIIE